MVYIYLLVAIALSVVQRSTSSKKNGVFYGKKNPSVTDERIKLWISNIHIITNQEYRSYWGSIFFYLMAFFTASGIGFLWSVVLSIGLTQLTSSTASYHWQKWINLGSGLPEIDPNESTKWELTIFGKSYWMPKFWVGKRRIWISILSGILIIIAIIIMSQK